MNHKKVKKQINKINAFFDSITADEEVSSIEKDLLLSYVRKLYETVLDSDSSSSKPTKKAKRNTSEQVIKKAPAKAVEPEPIVEAASAAAVERKPFERAPEVTATVEQVAAPVAEVIDIPAAPAVKVEKTVAAPIVSTTVPVSSLSLTDNMEAIFNQTSGTEISDKLSSLPIKDLTKSMGINERMFTVKELFGGDQTKFNTTLQDLNGLGNFEEAKDYLIKGVATELDWDDADKYKKAINFVKLVQRRYS